MTPSDVISFLIGVLFMMGNFWLVGQTWSRVLKKKSIALAGLIIVLKYPLLFLVLRFILISKEIKVVAFVIGLVIYPMLILTKNLITKLRRP